MELKTNPIRIIRMERHLTISDLSDKIPINYQTVYLNECGVFPTIVPKIKSYLIRELEANEEELDKAYRRFVLDKRRFFALEYADKLQTLPEPDLTYHPFVQFRRHIHDDFGSRMRFAKTVCVEPAGLYRLERRPLPELPGRIREALLQVGVPSENVQELNERINEFYARTK